MLKSNHDCPVALSAFLFVASVTMLFGLEACAQQGKGRPPDASQQNEQLKLVPYRKGSKWGFSDRSKKLVIQPR
jgi:hypothetical protein